MVLYLSCKYDHSLKGMRVIFQCSNTFLYPCLSADTTGKTVWSAVENGINVRENDANGTEIVSPLMIVIYIMLYDGSVMYCKPKTK